jgi:hypothetical protein
MGKILLKIEEKSPKEYDQLEIFGQVYPVLALDDLSKLEVVFMGNLAVMIRDFLQGRVVLDKKSLQELGDGVDAAVTAILPSLPDAVMAKLTEDQKVDIFLSFFKNAQTEDNQPTDKAGKEEGEGQITTLYALQNEPAPLTAREKTRNRRAEKMTG